VLFRSFGCSLLSSRIFLIDVASNPAKPRLVKVIEDIPEKVGLTGPHSPYALPGRMLLSFLGGKDGGLPAGLAEFTNEGEFIRKIELPQAAPYMYDVAVKPGLNRMVTSSFTPQSNYKKPFAKMDLKDFGNDLLVWDFRERKVLETLKTGSAPLECRWSLKEGGNFGFTNCALDDSIWVWEGGDDGKYQTRKFCTTGKLPADLRQSPDDRFLYVSCFLSNEIQQWDVSDRKNPRLTSTIAPGVQPNMMHVTGDGKRLFISMNQAGKVVMFDISNPEKPIVLKALDLGPSSGPHYIVLTPDEKRLVVSDYFLNEDSFGKVHAEGDHKVHVARVEKRDLILDSRFHLDFNSAFATGPARPHGIAIK